VLAARRDLFVVARTDEAHRNLSRQFEQREIEKEYWALVAGDPKDRDTIDLPLGRHPKDRKRMAVVAAGRRAVSHFEVVERFCVKKARFSLLKVRIETGRTHQIRVHLAARGHAVLADETYGRPSELLSRQALHAARLSFSHPTTGSRVDVAAPLPEDLERALSLLRVGRASP
jgi:23S rRNA pseudouridine1911/1915/1917 synthase